MFAVCRVWFPWPFTKTCMTLLGADGHSSNYGPIKFIAIVPVL